MTRLHSKKRIEIVVEAARAEAILEMVEAAGATGYTVISDVAGKGKRGIRDDAHLSDVFRNKVIVVIASDDVASRIIEHSQAVLENYAGIVTVSDVSVLRADHF
jgi:nitrogen regulatory protein PII